MDKKATMRLKKLKDIYNKPGPPHHPSTAYPNGRAMEFVPGNFDLATSTGSTQDQRETFTCRKPFK